ncbi:MAG TPA: hypothetical protein VI278_11100, partial [Nitrososphaeraceae archaeon]
NTLFLTMVHQIEAQIQLAENNFPDNAKLAEQHANIATSLLNQNDPIVNDTSWAKEIAERNPRVAAELTSSLNSLRTAINTQSKPASTIVSTANTSNDIKTKVNRISDLLAEAISSRISKEVLNNSTTQALVLSRLANLIYFSYGRALGESPATISNMAGMAMPGKGTSSMNMNMNMNNNMKTDANATMSSKMTAPAMTTSGNNNNAVIKNITEYQTAQSLTAKAHDILNKNLKPIAPPNAASANTRLDKDLNQLKMAIDNKTPFMDIMKIVHVQIHPLLITTYNLPLKYKS